MSDRNSTTIKTPSTTTPKAAGTGAPSTDALRAAAPIPAAPQAQPHPATQQLLAVNIGATVLVRIDTAVVRPMIVSAMRMMTEEPDGGLARRVLRLNGTIFCEPEDHLLTLFRMGGSDDPAVRFTGRPDRHNPMVYAEGLLRGNNIGNFLPRLEV